MGISSPESALPGAVTAMVTRRSLALLVLVMAVMLSFPLVRAARFDVNGRPPPIPSDESSEESSEENGNCKDNAQQSCRDILTEGCILEICDKCCQSYHSTSGMAYCNSCPVEHSPIFYLVAQVALGTALVVAIAALISVVLRSCSKESGRRRRPQIRTSAGSMTSADVYFTERLQDCPPCYDEIRWEKPPSYGSLPVLEDNSTDGPARQGPSVSPSGEAPRSPPPYGGIYTITQRVIQMQAAPATNSDDDRGIVFIATSTSEEANKNESTDDPKESKEAKTGETVAVTISQ